MFTNQNLIILVTILCGLLTFLVIAFNYPSKREREIRVKDEQELMTAVKDSINAHTDQQMERMLKTLLDTLEADYSKKDVFAPMETNRGKTCLYCKEVFVIEKGNGSGRGKGGYGSRKFCKSKHGRLNYCRDSYNGIISVKDLLNGVKNSANV